MSALRKSDEPRGFVGIGLENPKFAANVGAVLRAAGCYGAEFVAVRGLRYKRAGTDTQKAYRHLPLFQVEDLHEIVPFDCVPVAVDLLKNARSLPQYQHPERAFYIFGSEDGTLGRSVIDWCRDVIYVPTRFCMNLASLIF